MKKTNWFKKLLAGMGIGIGSAIPGVSGATIAVILKVYENIIWAVNNLRKKFSRSIAILFPVLLGVVGALIPCIILFDLALDAFVFGIMCIFAGFILGSIPGIKDEIKDVKPNKTMKICFIIGFILVIVLGLLSVIVGGKIDLTSHFNEMPWWLYLVLIPVGAIAAVALVVPGLSGSFILLILGFYKPLLEFTVMWTKELLGAGDTVQSFANIGKLLGMLGCFAVGVLLGVIFISKIMEKLFAKHRNATYFAIIGFVLGSIITLFFNQDIFGYYLAWAGEVSEYSPALPIYIEIPLGLLLMAITTTLSYLLVKANRKKKQDIRV